MVGMIEYGNYSSMRAIAAGGAAVTNAVLCGPLQLSDLSNTSNEYLVASDDAEERQGARRVREVDFGRGWTLVEKGLRDVGWLGWLQRHR